MPETYLVDTLGRIRYRHVGPLTAADVEQKLLPLVARLAASAAPGAKPSAPE